MSTPHDLPGVQWRKSSRSSGSGQCVEVAALGGLVAMRDSKAPADGTLALSRAAFADLLARAGRGDPR
ncbi:MULTISPECIES: DUF397 domain-containing protein [Thermomonosporaceae]|uniref:DUF397 domain-containing protein n=1 Tax=Thermomonosporaceae TaxID=2012 RepID=UPI00255AEE79|nr:MULTISPECIES: DUF397 domain-containing protein [Thermomonosporaceae]MDL4772650.1 DUF397 domain-containing protein [Actinomadura xylanilytica]